MRAFDSPKGDRFAQKKGGLMDLPTQIEQRLRNLGVRSTEVRERFVLGGGPGGQKINRTASAVELWHAPSGLSIRCQESRSREKNRQRAWERLTEKLEQRQIQQRAAARQAREKRRRRNRPKSAAQKSRQVADKRHRSQIKATRGRVRPE